MDMVDNTSVRSSDFNLVSITDVSDALPSDTFETPQVTRRGRRGRPRSRGRPITSSVSTINLPIRRRGRPVSIVSPPSVDGNVRMPSQASMIVSTGLSFYFRYSFG